MTRTLKSHQGLLRILGALLGTVAVVLQLSVFPRVTTPPLEDRITKAVQGLEDSRLLIEDLEREVERLGIVNEELTQEQLDLEAWLRVKEHEDTLRPYFASLTQRSIWERRILTLTSILAGWLLGFATPTIKTSLGRVVRRWRLRGKYKY